MKTILLVDDEFDTIDVLEMLLRLEGFEVLKAYDGLQALEVAEAGAPDLIVTDLMMPRMNGLELAQRLRSQAATRHIPIIMNSAGHEPQTEGAHPYSAFLEKPVDIRRLLQLIEALLP